MKRVIRYAAQDGTQFESPDECEEHDRKTGFEQALFDFLSKHSDQLRGLDPNLPIWDAIFDHAEDFQIVLDAAKKKKRRGRPRGSTTKKSQTSKVQQKPIPTALLRVVKPS